MRFTGLCVGVVSLVAISAQAQSASANTALAVIGLETDATAEALGIDDRAPRLQWALASDRRGVQQTGFRVLVATRPELLREGRADMWDSGEIRSAEPWVVYAGAALRPRARYWWTVRVTTGNARKSVWSPTWFETGLMTATNWRGQWIAGPERRGSPTPAEGAADDSVVRAGNEFCRPVRWLTSGFAARLVPNNEGECREVRPAPMLRKSFTIAKPVARARIYASGLAYNDLRINGTRASDRVLDPGFTRYNETVLYTTHDVTALLQQGENVVATELGSGQFDDAARTWDWGWHEAEWRATPRLRLDMYVTYTDGTEDVITSDASWRVSVAGPTRFDNYYLGETYDARREIPGWDRAGFDASSWARARVVSAPAGVVRAQTHEPIRVVASRTTRTRSETILPGPIVYDVGQTLTGWVTLHVTAPAGTPIELFYSEKLDSAGRASTVGNDLVFGQLQTDYYIARGGGPETWTPRFSYKGFRYVQISGPNGQPLPADVRVTVDSVQQVRSSVPATSTFVSSNGTLNRIHRNTRWAIQSNFQGVITDTPVYEKNAWTGDAQLTAGTASTLFDTERLYGKLVQDMIDGQSAHGEVTLLAPTNQHYGYAGKPAFKPADCCGATPAWDAFWFVIPWEDYQRFGDRRVLERAYPAMQKYLDEWIPQWTSRDGDGLAYTLTSGLGDWVPPDGVPTINRIASTAYYAHMARIASNTARALGRAADASRYDVLFENIRRDFNTAFLGADGVYRERPIPGATVTQAGGPPGPRTPMRAYVHTAQILPLAFSLVPDTLRAAVARRLADDILKNNGGNAYVGVLGARYVLPVLTETGHHDAAFTVATQTDQPSWGYWTDSLGFTSLGEHWYAATRSQNHHMFGAIVQWFYESLAGVRPLEPGYKRIEFRPEIPSTGLDSVSVTYESVRGLVASRWLRTATGLELDVTVPPNATGVVYVPATSRALVSETSGARPLRAESDRVVYAVGSGTYHFRVRAQR